MTFQQGQILLLADSHLMENTPECDFFFKLLERIESTCADVAFLGDVFELWVGGKHYESAFHRRFMDWCRKELRRRKIYFIEGNHEYFIRQRHADLFTEISDKSILCSGGELLLTHGDTFNSKDRFYRIFRRLVRNGFTGFLLNLFAGTIGPKISEKIRTDLKTTNMKQKHFFPEKDLVKYAENLREKQIPFAAAGHFHKEFRVGNLMVLPNWCAPDFPLGIFTPGKGIEIRPAAELFEGLCVS